MQCSRRWKPFASHHGSAYFSIHYLPDQFQFIVREPRQQEPGANSFPSCPSEPAALPKMVQKMNDAACAVFNPIDQIFVETLGKLHRYPARPSGYYRLFLPERF